MWMTEDAGDHSVESSRQLNNRLMIKSRGRVIFVVVDEIDWIEAEANYLRLHLCGNVAHLSRQTMGQVTQQLDSSCFLRIHRSFIVNVSRIREVQPTGRGDFVVVLRDGKELPCSRSYRHALRALYSQTGKG